jgi:hypothetical protein
MSKEEYDALVDHLTVAKQSILWAVNVLHDPQQFLQGLDLTDEEAEALSEQCLTDVEELYAAMGRLLFARHLIEVRGEQHRMIGPTRPWQARILAVHASPRLPSDVGPIPPWRDLRPDIRGRRLGREETEADVGPIPPIPGGGEDSAGIRNRDIGAIPPDPPGDRDF